MQQLVTKIYTSDDLVFLTEDDLLKPETAKKLEDYVNIVIEDKDSGSAWKLRKKIKHLLDLSIKKQIKLDPLLAQKYEDIMILASFIDMEGLPDREIESVFRSKVLFALSHGVDVMDAVKMFIVGYDDEKVAVDFANLVMRALGYNDERLGNFNILVDEKTLLETQVKNWLRSYNQFFSNTQRRGQVEEGEYLLNNKNVAKLAEEERKILIKLFQLYDFLRFPEQFGQSELIETNKALSSEKLNIPEKVISEKEIIEKSSMLNSQKEIIAAYQGDPNQQKAIQKEEEKLQVKFRQDMARLWAEFFTAVQKKNVNLTIAILRLLTRGGDLLNLLKDDVKLNSFLAAIWEKRYGKDFAAEFVANPGHLKFIRLFLRYVLEERLGLSSNDAARIGLQIGNIFVNLGKKEYNKMAYFDVKKKQFTWFE